MLLSTFLTIVKPLPIVRLFLSLFRFHHFFPYYFLIVRLYIFFCLLSYFASDHRDESNLLLGLFSLELLIISDSISLLLKDFFSFFFVSILVVWIILASLKFLLLFFS